MFFIMIACIRQDFSWFYQREKDKLCFIFNHLFKACLLHFIGIEQRFSKLCYYLMLQDVCYLFVLVDNKMQPTGKGLRSDAQGIGTWKWYSSFPAQWSHKSWKKSGYPKKPLLHFPLLSNTLWCMKVTPGLPLKKNWKFIIQYLWNMI